MIRRTVEKIERVLAAGGAFVLERWRGADGLVGTDSGAPIWLIPLKDGAGADGQTLETGSVWVARGPTSVAVPPKGDLLVAYAGPRIRFSKPGR